MRQIVFPSLVFLSLLQIFIPSSMVLGQQQGQWGQVQPFWRPHQFAPLQNSQGSGLSGQQKLAQRVSGQNLQFAPLQNSQSSGLSGQQKLAQGVSGQTPQFAPLQNSQGSGLSGQQQKLVQRMSGQKQPKTGSLSSNGPVLGGKIHLLSTLWKGMRNSGLERSIAGDILEWVLKISLRDLLVPFKRDVLFPLLS